MYWQALSRRTFRESLQMFQLLAPQVEAMRNFEGEETIRGRRVNVLSGLELHKQLLSGPEEQAMIEHIRSWVAAVSHKCLKLSMQTIAVPF